MSCSTDITLLQQNIIQNYNLWLTARRTIDDPTASFASKTQATSNIVTYYNNLIGSINCMTEYLNNNMVNPQQNFNELRNLYYNTIVPMRKTIENKRNEAKVIYDNENSDDHRYEIEKQNYNATVYIYIMLTVLATVLLYYVLLNIVRR